MNPEQQKVANIITAPQTHLVPDKIFVGSLKAGSTTPSVKGLTVFTAVNTGAVTVTDFLDGQVGQTITILGDGFMTVAHGTTIKTNTAANKLLATNKVYRFTKFANAWVEDA